MQPDTAILESEAFTEQEKDEYTQLLNSSRDPAISRDGSERARNLLWGTQRACSYWMAETGKQRLQTLHWKTLATASKRVGRKSNGPTTSLEEEFAAAGKLFSIMARPWLPDNFKFPVTPTSFDPASPDRFDTPEGIRQGIITELYDIVPDNLHPHMESEDPTFERVFKKAINDQRIQLNSMLMRNRPIYFLSVPTEAFTNKGRATFESRPEVQALVVRSDRPGQRYPLYAPVLYEDTVARPRHQLFMSTLISDIIGSCLFANHSNIGTKSKGKKWGVEKITLGAIATASIFIRRLLSCDKVFQTTGTNSGIAYMKDHDKYLKFLLIEHPHHGERVLQHHTRLVFGDPSTSTSEVVDIPTDAQLDDDEFADMSMDAEVLVPELGESGVTASDALASGLVAPDYSFTFSRSPSPVTFTSFGYLDPAPPAESELEVPVERESEAVVAGVDALSLSSPVTTFKPLAPRPAKKSSRKAALATSDVPSVPDEAAEAAPAETTRRVTRRTQGKN